MTHRIGGPAEYWYSNTKRSIIKPEFVLFDSYMSEDNYWNHLSYRTQFYTRTETDYGIKLLVEKDVTCPDLIRAGLHGNKIKYRFDGERLGNNSWHRSKLINRLKYYTVMEQRFDYPKQKHMRGRNTH